MSKLRSTLLFLPDQIQRRGLEDDIMSPTSKFRFVLNNNIKSINVKWDISVYYNSLNVKWDSSVYNKIS